MMTGRTKQAVLFALRDVARDKHAPAKLRWQAAQQLMELEGWGISNKQHTPKTGNEARASKLKDLAKKAREAKELQDRPPLTSTKAA